MSAAPQPPSRLAKAAEICGWSDPELASIVGRPVATVRAYRTGLRREYLAEHTRANLLRAVRLWIDQAEQGYAELRRMT